MPKVKKRSQNVHVGSVGPASCDLGSGEARLLPVSWLLASATPHCGARVSLHFLDLSFLFWRMGIAPAPPIAGFAYKGWELIWGQKGQEAPRPTSVC